MKQYVMYPDVPLQEQSPDSESTMRLAIAAIVGESRASSLATLGFLGVGILLEPDEAERIREEFKRISGHGLITEEDPGVMLTAREDQTAESVN